MKVFLTIILFIAFGNNVSGQKPLSQCVRVDYYGQTFRFYIKEHNMTRPVKSQIRDTDILASEVLQWYTSRQGLYIELIDSLLAFKKRYELNDWLYYQLIRKVAQYLSPKEADYKEYTLYKWLMLASSGYDARIAVSGSRIVFYVRCDEDIADVPYFLVQGNKYMCLNYHDYASVNLNDNPPVAINIDVSGAESAFSYKVTRMPEFSPENYEDKKLSFQYGRKTYHFNIRLNLEVQKIFANYPGVDFETYFNIPLSRETYHSLIPILKKQIQKMSQQQGVDYLMRFTRYAFLYENDEKNFGKEKRMSPEETLLSPYSDCDDRAALFFFLVKEIYNLPMIALLYPSHITMAVQFDKPVGWPVQYKGKIYSVCEPTPEIEDLNVGELASNLKGLPYKVVYQYDPKHIAE